MRVLRYLSYLLLAVVLLAAAGWFWLLHTAPGARFAWERAEAALGGALSADELSGDLAGGLRLEGFGLALPGVDITADTVGAAIDVDLMPLSIEVTGATVQSLFVDVHKSDAAGTDSPDVRQVLRQLRLPIWLRIGSLAIDDARLGLPDREEPVVIDRAGLSADWRDRIFVDRLEIRAPRASASASGMLELSGRQNFDLAVRLVISPALAAPEDRITVRAEVAGDPGDFTIDADGEAGIGGRDSHAFSIDGTGTLKALDIESFDVSGADLRASGSGRVALVSPLSARAAITIEYADPSPFIERWPGGHPLSGNLDVAFEPGRLELEDTRLAVARADALLTLAAVVDLDREEVRGDVEWQRLAWPLGAEEPVVSSRGGRLDVAGTLDDWRADGSFSLSLRGLEETTLDLEGRGNRTRAGLEIANAALFGGRVAGSASVAWAGERPWAVNLYAIDIDTGTIDVDWPGRLSGLLRATGNVDRNWLRAAVVDVDGVLRARRFGADGGIEVDGGRFVAHGLSLEHGDSRFDLDGAYWAAGGIRFDVSIADIGHYLDDAGGAVSGSGRLSLYEPAPFLRLDASSEFLRVGELVVSGLQIDDRGGGDGKALQAAIRARDITVGEERFIEPRMLLGASPDAQSARVSARYAELAFDMRLEGAFDSWRQPSAWRGFVNTLQLDAGGAGRIELLDAAAVSVSADAVDLSSLCLAGPGDERLCVEARWVERRQLEVDATLANIPVALVNRLVDTGYDFDQALSGDINWSYIRDEGIDGGGKLSISAGRVISDRRPGLAIRTGNGRLGFSVSDGRLLAGEASLPLPGTGAIEATVEVADLGDVKNSGLDGRLEADLDDIALLAVFLPDFDAPDGRLRATIDVAGTLAEPLVTGSANLDGGRVDYLPLGLELRDADLAVDLGADRFVAVSGSVRAGDGRAWIEPLPFAADDRPPGVHVAIRGENLALVSVPDVSAQANLDMQAGYDGKRLTLGGRIDVPRARVQPETLPAAKQTVSDDVVIVAGELPGETRRRPGDGLEMHGELAVSLGPDVRVRIDVATAMVTGTTTFTWDGDPMPVADGRYVVTGEVQAFGILLTIDEGTVRFPKVAANNPSLRIRAEREIFGNTQVRQAGVLIDGTLARPTLTPYTDPPTTEERALTLLVTGSDFNLEEGVGAIDFGTYIAPRLYVSYGISLFGQDNVISARYDLTEGFGIRATSGQTDSGLDLIYRIER